MRSTWYRIIALLVAVAISYWSSQYAFFLFIGASPPLSPFIESVPQYVSWVGLFLWFLILAFVACALPLAIAMFLLRWGNLVFASRTVFVTAFATTLVYELWSQYYLAQFDEMWRFGFYNLFRLAFVVAFLSAVVPMWRWSAGLTFRSRADRPQAAGR